MCENNKEKRNTPGFSQKTKQKKVGKKKKKNQH
jgi:hypothetical protein